MPEFLTLVFGVLLLAPGPADQVSSSGPDDTPVEFGRERFLLRRKYGKDHPFHTGFSFGPSFPLPVKAGRDIPGLPPRERPLYSDLFSPGFHASLEGAYLFRPYISLLIRTGVELLPGRKVHEGVLGPGEYGHLWIFPLHGGIRLSAPLSLPASTWDLQDFTPAVRGTAPFLELLVGMAHRPAVERRPGGEYWRRATVFSASLSGGVEVRFGSLAVSASAGLAYHSEPPEGLWYAEAEAAFTARITGSLGFRF